MKVSNEVLPVLSALEVDGGKVRIVEQLDRKLYKKVDEVLQALGGKWNTKAKAHLFPAGDPSDALSVVMMTGEVATSRDVGFFPTPEPIAGRVAMLAGVQRGLHVLEPSAGTGRLVDAALALGAARVTCVERDIGRIRELAKRNDPRIAFREESDFLEMPRDTVFDAVAMNPPFVRVGGGDHLEHVRHAFAMLAKGGTLAAVLPCSIEWRRDRRHAAFRDWYSSMRHTVDKLPDDAFRESGTMVRTVILAVRKP